MHVRSLALCSATRHMDEFVCVDVTVMSQIPAFVSRCRSTCMLFSRFVSFPLHLSVSRVLSQSPAEGRKGSAPVSIKGYQLRAAAAVQACCTDKQWKHQCSITSGAALLRDPVTFDRFKTPAPPLIRFPEPPTFLCFQPCSCSPFYFVLFIGFSLKRVI